MWRMHLVPRIHLTPLALTPMLLASLISTTAVLAISFSLYQDMPEPLLKCADAHGVHWDLMDMQLRSTGESAPPSQETFDKWGPGPHGQLGGLLYTPQKVLVDLSSSCHSGNLDHTTLHSCLPPGLPTPAPIPMPYIAFHTNHLKQILASNSEFRGI